MSFFYTPKIESRPFSYFPAANTSNGFVSYFDKCFGDTRRIIIKGGPGTGKSTLMRKFAEMARSLDLTPIYYYCSSDTNSLDAVVVKELSLTLLDGTPPHAEEPRAPGALDEIINLGDFWNTGSLISSLSEIKNLNSKMASLYKSVYSLLCAARKASTAIYERISPYILTDKLSSAAERTVRREKIKGRSIHRQCEALGTHGALLLDTFKNDSCCGYKMRDKYGISTVFLKRALFFAEKLGIQAEYSLCPVDGEVNCLRIGKTLFSEHIDTNDGDRVLNMERFISRDIKKERSNLRSLEKMCRTLSDEAISTLAEIGALHARLEKIYIDAMDFGQMHSVEAYLYDKITSSVGR